MADRASAADRLIALLADSSLGADVVVVDVPNDLGRAGHRICQAADTLVMVTTSETAAVVGAFAAIKRLVRFDRSYGGSNMAESISTPCLMVNKAPTVGDARIVRHRLRWACRRLLGVEIVETDFGGGCVGGDSSSRGDAPRCPPNERIGDWSRPLQIGKRKKERLNVAVLTADRRPQASTLLSWKRRAKFDARPFG